MTKTNKKFGLRREDAGDRKISLALMASFVILTIQYFVLIFFELIGTAEASAIQLLSKGLVGLMFFYALPVVLKRSKIKFIFIYFLATLIFMVNYLFFSNNREVLQTLFFPLFFMCLPAFIFSLSIQNISIFRQVMKRASFIVFLVGTILGILIFLGESTVGTYSMALSYYMLLPAIIYFNELINKFSLRSLLFFLVSLLIILSLGSRGAMLCILIFVGLKLLRYDRKSSYSRKFYQLITLVALITALLSYKYIFTYIYNLLFAFGIQSRSILLFLQGDLHLSGRDKIYQNTLTELSNNPISGIGLGGDRVVSELGYSHNFFVEILANFGVVTGSVLLVGLLILIFKSLLLRNDNKYTVFAIWVCLGYVPLLVSRSYLEDISFWIFLGILLNISVTKHKKECSRNYLKLVEEVKQ